MTEYGQITMIDGILAFISLFCIVGWYIDHRRAKSWENAATAYFQLLEEQKTLVDGVLELNDAMLADRIEMYRLQERDFVTRTGIGNVH
jgi:hypothetical protein